MLASFSVSVESATSAASHTGQPSRSRDSSKMEITYQSMSSEDIDHPAKPAGDRVGMNLEDPATMYASGHRSLTVPG